MSHTLSDHDNEMFHHFGQHGDDCFAEAAMNRFDDELNTCTSVEEMAELMAEVIQANLTGSLDNKYVRAKECAFGLIKQFIVEKWSEDNREAVYLWHGSQP